MQQSEERNPSVPHVLDAIGEMIAKVAKEGIGKDRKNTDQKYNFRGIDDVRNVLAPLMDECKLVILPKMKGREEKERTTKSGGFALQVVVHIDFHFVSRVDGSEVIVPMSNEAVDYSDKATNKAISQAYKAVCINTFNIPTEGEEDTDEEKRKDLKSSRKTAFNNKDECDKFVSDYLAAVAKQTTRHGLKDIGNIHAVKLEAMKLSDDEHERMVVGICRNKHQEALDEIIRKETEAKSRTQTVSGVRKAASDDHGN